MRRKRKIVRKLLLKHFLSPGDIVMLTAAVRDLHQCYPGQFVTDVRTSCPALWENNPYLTPLDETDLETEIIECEYPLINRSNVAPYHCLHGFIEFLNDRLGLQIKPSLFHGDIHLSDLEKSWFSQVHERTGEDTPFWIVAAGGKFDVTIKWWETDRYQKVVDHFRGKIIFVQVGELHHHHPKLERVIDLRGTTDLRQLVRLVYHAQGVLCPVTALMHLAAAVERKGSGLHDRPCVVVAGAREPVHWEAYPFHQFIHTVGALACDHGGCWKARTVPLGDGDERDAPDSLCVNVAGSLPRCMDMITPAEVIRRIESYFAGGSSTYLTSSQAAAAEEGIARGDSRVPADGPIIITGAGPERAILIQQASGLHTAMLDLTARMHSDFAGRHGLAYWSVRGDVQSERPPVWNKVLLIKRAMMMGFDLVVWLDADTLIVRPDAEPRCALPNGPPVGMCRHPIPWGAQPWHFNAGVMFVRNSPMARQFFDRVWNDGPVADEWQEQARMNDLAQELPGVVQRLDDRWNCTEGVNQCANPVILAWHGRGPAAIGRMRRVLRTTVGNRRSLRQTVRVRH